MILYFCFLMLFTACKGQHNTQVVESTLTNPGSDPTMPIPAKGTIGDTVKALGPSILIIYQATNGHYWFGSDVDGVYRYDGQYIIQYTTEDGLCNNTIREIKEDKEGNMFFSTQFSCISKFDGEKFTTLRVTKSDSPQKNWKFQPDDLWFRGGTGQNGPYRYDGTTLYQLEFPRHYFHDEYYAKFPSNSWSPYDVYYIYSDRKGNVWLGTGNFGICRYDGTSLSWLYEDHLTYVPDGGSFGIRSIIEDKEGNFWFCNTKYRYAIRPNSDPATYRKEKGVNLIEYTREKGIEGIQSNGNDLVYFMSAIEDKHGDMWMATYGEGVWKYSGKNVTYFPVLDGAEVVTLYSIYEDHRGDLWLGTHEQGAYKFNGKAFEKFRP